MKTIKVMLILVISLILAACGGGGSGGNSPDLSGDTIELSSEEQAELVAASLSAEKGGVSGDFTSITQSASGSSQHQLLKTNSAFSFNVSVNIDYYDELNNLQEAYNEATTDRIDYDSLIQGDISGGEGYFTELSIDNSSVFTVDEILSRTILVNGTHINNSSYSRTQFITQANIHYELDCELFVTDITVDLDADDSFPESGIIEGTISGAYERIQNYSQHNTQFDFHFIATYTGDNTAEVELDDGTVFIIQLGSDSIQYRN